jgi:hypothetical protein
LFTWGGTDDFDEIYSVLEGVNAPLWDLVAPPKHRLVFQGGHHWDHLPAGQSQCQQTRGPCNLVPLLAADFAALFLTRYMPPPASTIPRIPLSLTPAAVELTPEQQVFASGRLAGLAALSSHPECVLQHHPVAASQE